MAAYQSLYRRYRPQRFADVLGQDHVTEALRNAVRDGRVGHAYLFSGPRGTGKTSTARILAKVLNCEAPANGEPCGSCDNCVAVAAGRVVDWLLEQDAASKSKVDDMRDLIDRVPLGTSGSRKVIILDEVHMLSQGAENALLKTLEEPPDHVVFVLATTDPEKVRATIRSRTQHFAFRLWSADVTAEHVRYVIDDAGLSLGDDVVEHVVRRGAGSARDALSALDQLAALGKVVDELQPVDAVVDAVCARDPGAALVAVAEALAAGQDPRTLGEALISALRDAFLAVMGAGDAHLTEAARARATEIGESLGPAGITRALDVVGEALTELHRKPDPRVVLEVALVRLTRPDADRSLDAILERLERLERVERGSVPAEPGATPPPTSASNATSPTGAPDRGRSAGSPPASSGATSQGAGGRAGGSPAAGAKAALADARSQKATTPSTAPVPHGPDSPTLGAITREGGESGGSADSGPAPAEPGVAPSPGTSAEPDSWAGTGPSAEAQPGASAGTSSPSAPSATTGPSAEAKPGASAGTSTQPGQSAGPTAGTPAARQGAGPAAGSPGTQDGPTAEPTAASAPSLSEVLAAWDAELLPSLDIPVRSKWRGGRWLEASEGALRFAVPNEWHQRACQGTQRDVEAALQRHFGRPVRVAVITDAAGAGAPDGPASSDVQSAPPAGAEDVDLSDLRDADDVATGGVELLMRELGGELIEEDTHE